MSLLPHLSLTHTPHFHDISPQHWVYPEKGKVSFQPRCKLPDIHLLWLRNLKAVKCTPKASWNEGTSAKATPCSHRADRLLCLLRRGSWTAPGRARSLWPALQETDRDSGTRGASRVLPPYASANSKASGSIFIMNSRKEWRKGRRKEGRHGKMQRETERAWLCLGEEMGRGGRKSLARKTKQFAKCRNKYSWLNSNPTGSMWGNKLLSKAKRFKGNWIYFGFT